MKKLLTTLLCSAIAGLAFAQDDTDQSSFISQGTFELTGGISLNYSDFEDRNSDRESDNYGFSLFPELGYAINDDLVLGLQLGFNYNEGNTTGDFDNTNINRSYSFTPLIKKYFLISDRFAFDLQGEVGYRISNNNRDVERTEWSAGVRPGLNYRLSESLGFSTQIGFLGYRNRDSEADFDDSKSQSFNLNLNSSDFRVALTYFF
ncbi:MAG: outer membrane beta-barrel protein [Nonlabens sp.]